MQVWTCASLCMANSVAPWVALILDDRSPRSTPQLDAAETLA